MKKLTLLFTTFALLGPSGTRECLADYKDMANQVETVADFWIGGSYNDTSSTVNSSLAEQQGLAEAKGRVGTNKASEYYALKSSGSGGVLFKSAPLPNRYHLEFDYYNDRDWFGDLRYSYKDYLQLRLLPRRLTHNLDNLTLFDFAPASATTSEIEIHDRGVDDYNLRIDIDQYRLRLKAPNYPLHFYSDGEVVRKKGNRQLRFIGGAAYFSGGTRGGRVRVTEAREVDQETRTIAVGTNAHLGPLEFDLSRKERKFESDAARPAYDYEIPGPATVNSVHNLTPKLKATTNTLKIHTSHTGRIFASATFSEMDKSNESSGAEAGTSLGYGEISWVPAAYLSLGAKYRHQKNDASAPATIRAIDRNGAATDYVVHPGVESQTDTAILSLRYSLIPKSSANLQYTHQIKDVEGESAITWARPQETSKDVYEFGFTNWAIPSVRTTAKLSQTTISNHFGDAVAGYEPVAIEPDHTSQGSLGIAWLISPKVTAFVNAMASREESTENRMLGGITNANRAKGLNEQYLLSFNFALSEKFSISPSYTYMSWKQKRDIVWEYSYELADPDATTAGDVTETRHVVDSDNTSKQRAQNFAVNIMAMPTKRLHLNGLIEYTVTKGDYNPTSPMVLSRRVNDGVVANLPFDFFTDVIGEFSHTDTKEWNIRLDSEYELGRGWGVGLDLRYVDCKDTSGDNPSDGVFYGGLFKVSKKLFY